MSGVCFAESVGDNISGYLLEEQIHQEELGRTHFKAGNAFIEPLAKAWREGTVASFDGMMVCSFSLFYSLHREHGLLTPIVRTQANFRGGWKWCCLNCFGYEDRFHLSAENDVPGYTDKDGKGWYNVMEFNGMFVCRHPVPEAGKSTSGGSSCYCCRGTKFKCAPLPSAYMTVFDKDHGVVTRYEAACEVLTIPNVPHEVAIAVGDELQRLMNRMVSCCSGLDPRRRYFSELMFVPCVGPPLTLQQDRLLGGEPVHPRLANVPGRGDPEAQRGVGQEPPRRRPQPRWERHHPRGRRVASKGTLPAVPLPGPRRGHRGAHPRGAHGRSGGRCV